MAKHSAGILMYRRVADGVRVLLVHPGGPFWQKKDRGAWTIPKGEKTEGEDGEAAARREFSEELGFTADGPLAPLGQVRQAGGKWVEAFALAGAFDVSAFSSNRFEIEWPPKSGHLRSFPEVDRAAWFTLEAARDKILAAQAPFLDRLEALVRQEDGATP
ncbi:NUDIX domain-containing protein [Labrys wisconsinensis]|uniref:NUDIX family NTP pyrophosphohydrolase n=1 Tax=Labrys wisconsinensis TaxID=425677 RepID=A0ABU0J6F3_9HYPH|nr:NUDIX domain-containing protein [Labrys wisconsinensis]MDQ0469837.1 putative NUDIX family NTP pyrophosphohydrolase [Labrys wisconsinensis]